MGYIRILMISIGLAMDAFAVAVCKGISCKEVDKKKFLLVGFMFGIFQAVMPLIGYYVGSGLRKLIFAIDHYIVFIFLVVIGVNMIYESICGREEYSDSDINVKSLIVPAIATSIDAFSVGIMFAFTKINLLLSVLTIGLVAFVLSTVGVYIGSSFGKRFERKAKLFGGLILIILGIENLIEHFLW